MRVFLAAYFTIFNMFGYWQTTDYELNVSTTVLGQMAIGNYDFSLPTGTCPIIPGVTITTPSNGLLGLLQLVPEWGVICDGGVYYRKNVAINLGGLIGLFMTRTTYALDYKSDAKYFRDDIVSYNGKIYRHRPTSTNQSVAPDNFLLGASQWEEVTINAWNASTAYAVNTVVRHQGSYYRSTVAIAAGGGAPGSRYGWNKLHDINYNRYNTYQQNDVVITRSKTGVYTLYRSLVNDNVDVPTLPTTKWVVVTG